MTPSNSISSPFPLVIYHKSDYDGIFCREIAIRAMGLKGAEFLGWDYGDKIPEIEKTRLLFMLDISIDSLMDHPTLIWIDHHKTAIEKYPQSIPGIRIDGVAACRLTYQWFFGDKSYPKESYVERRISKEPLAVTLAGEYDIWDHHDPRAMILQYGLRTRELTKDAWDELFDPLYSNMLTILLNNGEIAKAYADNENAILIASRGFDLEWEGLKFLAINTGRYNSQIFTAGIKSYHDALLGFCWSGGKWTVSMYHKPGREDLDLSVIAGRYGGGGHKGACGFTGKTLPFNLNLEDSVSK